MWRAILRAITATGIGFVVAGCSLFLFPWNHPAVTIDHPPAPAATSSPLPEDGDVNVAIGSQLSWAAAENATMYDVYFGRSLPLGSEDLLFQGTTDLSVDPGQPDHETRYYWRVDSINSFDRTSGDTWSFTTTLH